MRQKERGRKRERGRKEEREGERESQLVRVRKPVLFGKFLHTKNL